MTNRYARHLVLPEIGGSGQQALAKARVAILGLGGLGCPAAIYLASCGIGDIRLIDHDKIDESNLPRQILYLGTDVGQSKADVATERLQAIAPAARIQGYAVRAQEAIHHLTDCDVILDCLDNFPSRDAVSRSIAPHCIPIVSASAERFTGTLTTLKPWIKLADGQQAPRLRDYMTRGVSSSDNCETMGIFAPVTGILGVMQANEAIGELLGWKTGLVGQQLLFDVREKRFVIISVRRSSAT